MNDANDPTEATSSSFPKTRWSLVLDAQKDDPVALADLCKAYWYPLYCYARRLRNSHEDAEDLTQAFFQRLLKGEGLRSARQQGGKLRSFLLKSLENFAIDDWRRKSTQRKGSGKPLIEIDALDAQERYALEPRTNLSPELEFDRAWARQLLQQVMNRLQAAYEQAGKGALFQNLRDRLVPDGTQRPYADIATELQVSESVLRLAVFKLRKRFREMLKTAITETVSSENEVEEELNHLRSVFGN
ncbi:MAG: RNA polymerase sigma factor (sigma-70 family) [Verrucomicrobiales bacterium]|jgi:RNA polymerase sigma factor (sigma-70 family)